MKIMEEKSFSNFLEVFYTRRYTVSQSRFNPIDDIYILIGHGLMPRGYISVRLHAPS